MDLNLEKISLKLFFISFFFLAISASFSYGVLVWHSQLWPYKYLSILSDHLYNYLSYGLWAPKNLIVSRPDNASRQRMVIHDPVAMMPGYRAILGWDFNIKKHAVWLIDEHGNEVHRWFFTMAALTGNRNTRGVGKSHALVVLNDGSIVINFDDLLLARLDACSKPVWIKKGAYHHSLELNSDGSLWTWRGEKRHSDLYQFMERFNPWTGELIEKLSLIDDFVKNSSEMTRIFRIPQNLSFWNAGEGPEFDAFHANDIEELNSEISGKYPNFRSGDLLISLRNIDLVAVFDPINHEIKWWMQGPWIHQHDPDFGNDGKISVFNNNTGRTQSNIVFVNPTNNVISFAKVTDLSGFYTEEMGKHERLPNDNILITIPGEGRILELTALGKLAFEFNNILNEKGNGYVANARWLPKDFFISFPICAQ